jgi:hypothetical protein
MKGHVSMCSGFSVRKSFVGLLLCSLGTFFPGCGSESRVGVVAVKGQLLLDGKPLGPASLILTPTSGDLKHSSYGVVDDQGNIKFQTYTPDDGLPVGEFRVMVAPTMGTSRLPAIYFDDKASPATVRVDSQPADLKISLASTAGPPAVGNGIGGIAGAADPAAMLKAAMEAQPTTGGK